MEYEIKGGNLPVAIVKLFEGETVITQGGGMSWMSPNMNMETVGGGIGKVFGRLMSGESAFLNRYTAKGGNGEIAFASRLPGDIVALDISDGNEYIVQKSAFLASSETVDLSVYFQKKIRTGFFGGEGFIMQKLSGCGKAFIEVDGSAIEYNLGVGEEIVVDTGHVVLTSATCTMDIKTVKGIKNMFFGGEGLFNTVVKGPGRVILQTMPIMKLADALIPYFPQRGNDN